MSPCLISFPRFVEQGGKIRARDNSKVSSLKLRFLTENSGSEDSDVDSICLSDAGLAALGKGFPKLEKLSLIWCSNVYGEGLISLAQKCSCLKALDLQVYFMGLLTCDFIPGLINLMIYTILMQHS